MDKILSLIKINIENKKLTRFLVVLFVTSVSFLLLKYFQINLNGILLVLTFIVFSVLFMSTWFMAGVAVFKSVITASVGLSIVIFLTQTYCDLPQNLHTADDALRNLLMFGLAYSTYLFIASLYKELFGDNKDQKGTFKILEEVYGGKKPWMIVILYAIFIGLFIWGLYQVMNPIFLNFCVQLSTLK